MSRYDLCLRTNQVHSVLAVSRGRPSELLAGCPDYHLRCYNTGAYVCAVWMVHVCWYMYIRTCVCQCCIWKMFQGGGAKLWFQEIGGGGGGEGEPGIQLFSAIYAILIDIRLDEFPRGGGEKKARGGKCPPPPAPP